MKFLASNILVVILISYCCCCVNSYCQRLLLPAYVYPSSIDTDHFWNEFTDDMSGGIAIMNPNSGPSDVVNSDYVAAISIALSRTVLI